MAANKKEPKTPKYRLMIGRTIKGKLTFSRKEDPQLEPSIQAARAALKSGAKEVIISYR